jgi:hypothetical protein
LYRKKIRRFRSSRVAALTISGLAVLAVGGGITGVASASVAPLQVTLGGGTGGTATCNSDDAIVLNNGASGFAFAKVVSPPSAVPTIPPSFTTSAYGGGSPRWVINFSNGKFTTGYPVQLGVFAGVTPTVTFTGNQWGVGNGSSYMTWANVLTALGVTSTTTVTGASIVADGGWASQTTAVITNGQYNGQPLSCATVSPTPTPTPTSASPTATPSPSHSSFPVGGVKTGGGQSGTSLWLPLGAVLAALGAVALAGGAVARLRRQQG